MEANMDIPRGILVFGPNGSGKSTLGRELAETLGFHFMDIETYHFKKSDIPYTLTRSREDCHKLMLKDMEKHRDFVLSAVTGDFGPLITPFYNLAVWIDAPLDIRLRRIEQREQQKHGARIEKGGDMYEQHKTFVGFVASREMSKIVQWADTLTCPVIRMDGMADYHTSAVDLARCFHDMQ